MAFGLILLFSGLYTGLKAQQQDAAVVDTRLGQVSGTLDANGVHSFKGIPFATPPVGELRWKRPQPAASWDGVRACEEFGPSPMQAKPAPFAFWSSEFLIPEEPISEDCLYLNVWTAAPDPQAARPVLVYIYGGGFRSGGAGCPIYDGAAMAQKDIVYVSINYRVGLFGFLAHPELTEEAGGTSGNYAIMDMIAGLEWVRDNIAGFGGDPNNVTIAGQSAGSFAVNYLTVAPGARGLFHRAIGHSGAGFLPSQRRPLQTLEQAEAEGLLLAEELGAADLEALRLVPAERFVGAQHGSQWPLVDGTVIPESIFDAYAAGHQAQVPLLLGWNSEDILGGRPLGPKEFAQSLEERFGDRADAFSKAYPSDNEEVTKNSQNRLGRDQVFGVQAYTWAQMQARQSDQPVYLYNFTRQVPAYDEATRFGAFHSGEIVYAYDNLHTLDRPWESGDELLADLMSGYWAQFARAGNPNREGAPNWEPFDPESPKVMVLDTASETKTFADAELYALWQHYLSDGSYK